MAQHPAGGSGDGWPWRDPGEGAQLHPLGVKGGGIGSELSQQLLFLAVKPAFTTGLLRRFVMTAIFVGHVSHGGDLIREMRLASCVRSDSSAPLNPSVPSTQRRCVVSDGIEVDASTLIVDGWLDLSR